MALFQTLPLAFHFILLELVLGSAAVMTLTEARREVPIGFLRFMAVSIGLTIALALWSRGRLPDELLIRAGVDAWLLWVALAAAAAWTWFAYRERPRGRVAAGLVVTAAVCAALAIGLRAHWEASSLGAGEALAQASFALASASLGASMVGMLLGHWYLVAPMLSETPLIRINAVFLVALLLQGALVAWFFLDRASGATPTEVGMVFWIRVLFGIAFPLVGAAFVWYSCRIRAMRTATGILYLAVAAVLMGDVAAKVVFFLTSVPI